MREPGDGVALAAAGRVLHQVITPRALRAPRRHQPAHGVKLVITWKDHGFLAQLLYFALAAARHEHVLFLGFEVQEPAHDIEQRIARPDLFPQIRRAVTLGIRRIARAMVVALIERQEMRRLPFQLGGHVPEVRVHGEMHQRAFLEAEHRLARVAILAVLAHGVKDVLLGERVLEFCRRHRQAVDGEHQIEGFLVLVREMHLARHRQPVLRIERRRLGVHPACRREVRHAHQLAETVEAVSQHVQHAEARQRLGEVVEQLRLGVLAMIRGDGVPDFRLGVLNELDCNSREQAADAVEIVRVALHVATVLDEMRLDGGLKGHFLVVHRHFRQPSRRPFPSPPRR